MRRWIVFLLLIALPVRTVLAVSGIGCTMMPSMAEHAAASTDSPCPMHEGESTDTNSSSTPCPSCDAACCAALGPQSTERVAVVPTVGDPITLRAANFDQIAQRSLERPPKAF